MAKDLRRYKLDMFLHSLLRPLPPVTVVALVLFAGFRPMSPWIPFSALFFVGLFDFVVWLYLWGVGRGPSMAFAAAVWRFGGLRAKKPESMRRVSLLPALRDSGRLAKILFRVVAGQRVNVTVRPDVAEYAARLSGRVMLAMQDTDSDTLSGEEYAEKFDCYYQFLKDVTCLIAIHRLDLIPAVADRENDFVGAAGLATDNAMRGYLRPLNGYSFAATVVTFVFPSIALLLSVIAVIVSAVKT